MRASRAVPATGLIAPVLLLAVLAGTTGLGAPGWVVGVACAVTMAAALARGLARGRVDRLEPASWVTLARATLAVGVAALAADSLTRDTPVALLVTLAAVALALASTPRYAQPSSRVRTRPGPAMPQHRSSTVTPGPMPTCMARTRISQAVMKLS